MAQRFRPCEQEDLTAWAGPRTAAQLGRLTELVHASSGDLGWVTVRAPRGDLLTKQGTTGRKIQKPLPTRP